MNTITFINPTTREKSGSIPESTPSEISSKIAILRHTTRMPKLSKRKQNIYALCEEIRDNRIEIANTITKETGRIYEDSIRILSYIPERYRYLTDVSESVLSSEIIEDGNISNEIHRVPVGVVAIISPWNYPVDIPLASIIPAYLAGNKIIFKPSEYATQTGLILSAHIQQHLGKDFFQYIVGSGEVGEELISNDIDMISFTGSTSTYSKFSAQLPMSVKRHLCLTGNDSMIISNSADIYESATQALYGTLRNNGASCSSVQNIFIHADVYDQALKLMKKKLKADYILGDPFDPKTTTGPVSNESLFANQVSIINKYRSRGKVIQIHSTNQKGFFIPPTFIEIQIEDADFLNEEIFSPLAFIIKYKDINEVINKISQSKFGLTSSIWSHDKNEIKTIIKTLRVGTLSVNALGRSNIQVPWSGVNASGRGIIRSKYSILEFTDIKVVRKVIQSD